ncbi:UNVERIFIED_CONTAM: hypothetical protein K2H54_055450 [Gekko kuhli]
MEGNLDPQVKTEVQIGRPKAPKAKKLPFEEWHQNSLEPQRCQRQMTQVLSHLAADLQPRRNIQCQDLFEQLHCFPFLEKKEPCSPEKTTSGRCRTSRCHRATRCHFKMTVLFKSHQLRMTTMTQNIASTARDTRCRHQPRSLSGPPRQIEELSNLALV